MNELTIKEVRNHPSTAPIGKFFIDAQKPGATYGPLCQDLIRNTFLNIAVTIMRNEGPNECLSFIRTINANYYDNQK